MGMLTKRDLELIGDVVQDKIDDALVVVNEGFTRVESRLTGVEGRLTKVENQLTRIDGRVTGVEGRLTKVETTMATKDFVDRKFNELRGDMVTGFRKIDSRFDEMTGVLKEKRVFTASDAGRVDSMRLYPKSPAA